MQPNQQSPQLVPPPASPPPVEAPLPYQVPEYLHLEPIVAPQLKKSRKGLKRIVILFTLMLLIAVTIAGIWFWHIKTTEKVFYNALDSLLQKKYIVRTMTISGKNPSVSANIKVISDFTPSARPKSQIQYDYSGTLSINRQDQSINMAGKLLSIERGSFLTLFTKKPSFPTWSNYQSNKWYKVSNKDTLLAERLDPLGIHESLNSTFCKIPMGEFDTETREKLIETLKKFNIYKIQNSKDDYLNGDSQTVITINLDLQNLKRLHDSEQNMLSVPSLSSCNDNDGYITRYDFWINKQNGQISKITVNSINGKSVVDTSMSFQYPAEISFETPEKAVDVAP